MTTLKPTTDAFIKRHWKDNEDYEFAKKGVQTLIDKYKEKIKEGEFQDKAQLFISCKLFLANFQRDILDKLDDEDQSKRLYNCFAFGLINELLEDF